MKKITLLFTLFMVSSVLFAQKKEKIKGSRVVTQSIYEIENFNTIEAEDNLEIILSKSETPSIEVEADDNLHDAINYMIVGNTLRITTFKDVIRSKKFALRINYTDSLHTIIIKGETQLSALNNLEMDHLTIKAFEKSKIALNLNTPELNLSLNDKSLAELNIKSETAVFELSQYAELETLISATTLVKLDMYENSEAKIEGNTSECKIRLDNSSDLIAKKLTTTTATITTEGYAKASIMVIENVSVSASGKSSIELYGEQPKVEITTFTNSATLYKKEL